MASLFRIFVQTWWTKWRLNSTENLLNSSYTDDFDYLEGLAHLLNMVQSRTIRYDPDAADGTSQSITIFFWNSFENDGVTTHFIFIRCPYRNHQIPSKKLLQTLLTFSLRSNLNCSKYCARSIRKHILCRTIQLPDHPPRFCNPRLEKMTQILYRHNLIEFLLFMKN